MAGTRATWVSMADPDHLCDQMLHKLLDEHRAGQRVQAVVCFALLLHPETTQSHWAMAAVQSEQLCCAGEPVTETMLYQDVIVAAAEIIADLERTRGG
jgi:hypothetical protein